MGYEPIRVIATSATSDGHVNRETTFDENPLSNKICYRDGLPYMTATPKSLGGKGPRRVDLNGLFYLFSCFLFELQMGNYPTYNADVVGTGKPLPDGYPLGAVLWYPTGGYFVRSLVANNTESDLTNTTKWAKITISAAELAAEATARSNADASKVNISINNVNNEGKTAIGTYSRKLDWNSTVSMPYMSAAPADCMALMACGRNDSQIYVRIEPVSSNSIELDLGYSNDGPSGYSLFINKGDKCGMWDNDGGTYGYICIPFKYAE